MHTRHTRPSIQTFYTFAPKYIYYDLWQPLQSSLWRILGSYDPTCNNLPHAWKAKFNSIHNTSSAVLFFSLSWPTHRSVETKVQRRVKSLKGVPFARTEVHFRAGVGRMGRERAFRTIIQRRDRSRGGINGGSPATLFAALKIYPTLSFSRRLHFSLRRSDTRSAKHARATYPLATSNYSQSHPTPPPPILRSTPFASRRKQLLSLPCACSITVLVSLPAVSWRRVAIRETRRCVADGWLTFLVPMLSC